MAHSHTPETDGRDFQVIVSKFALLHLLNSSFYLSCLLSLSSRSERSSCTIRPGIVRRWPSPSSRRSGLRAAPEWLSHFFSFNALRHDDQRSIGKGGTDRFGLSSIIGLSPNAAMQAVGVESFVTELAGAIGKGKRCDHPISPLDGRNHRSHVFHHSHPFMAQPPLWWKEV